jgi:hypothetical protein
MVECYRNLSEGMPENGAHVVMFTHQNAAVWADLALILWAAGLRVTSAWCIATETESSLKTGNYVQGTVLLVLRKQMGSDTAFLDEVYPEVEAEVRRQLDAMADLDEKHAISSSKAHLRGAYGESANKGVGLTMVRFMVAESYGHFFLASGVAWWMRDGLAAPRSGTLPPGCRVEGTVVGASYQRDQVVSYAELRALAWKGLELTETSEEGTLFT